MAGALGCVVEAALVETDFDEEDFAECFDVWPFVLYGFAAGARFIVPSGFVEDFGVGCLFVVGVSDAYDAGPAETARRRSNVERRWSNIYFTPMGFSALSGWVEVSEMTGAGSFGSEAG